MIQKYTEILKYIGFNPKTILEIGSRDARDANYLKNQFDVENDNVFIVEPNPLMMEQIKKNYPKFKTFEVAISTEEGTAEFNQVIDGGEDPIGVSSLLNRNDDFYERFTTNKIKVNTIRGSTLLEMIDREIDICKIDVEGLTYEVLQSFGDTIKKIKSFHLETEHLAFWENQKLHTDVCNLMITFGYHMVWEGYNPSQSDTIWVKTEYYNDYKLNKFKDLEIHTLICNKDVTLAINNFKSLQQFEEFAKVPVYLHDDGSLTPADIEILSVIKNVTVINRTEADTQIREHIKDYKNCLDYRLGDNPINLWHKIKLFDYFYFSKTKKVLGVDTDLLFLRRPTAVIKHIIEDTPFYFPDIQSAYCFNEPKDEVTIIPNVNTGLIFIPSEPHYNINSIEYALSNLIKNGTNYFPSWIEQSAFAHMFYTDTNYISLPPEKYKIPYFQTIDIDSVECLHFVSYPAVRNMYSDYIDYLHIENKTSVYKNTFIVNFKEHEIPLTVEILKYDTFYGLKYYWELEKTNQQFLDHILRITATDLRIEKKFQSDKTGFFIFHTADSKIHIEHTYDWYHETSWKELGKIVLTN